MSERPDPIAAWGEVSAAAAGATGYRAVGAGAGVPARRTSGLASIGVMTVALAIIVGALALRPATGPSANGPVTAETSDGMFRLALTTPRGTYGPGDPIDPVAGLTYLGPDASIAIQHGASPIHFRIEEVGGGRRVVDADTKEPCFSTNLVKDALLAYPFRKGGPPTDPQAGFDRAWYDDPTLSLPVGTWRIVVDLSLTVGGCGGDRHVLSAENLVRVVAPTGDGPVTDVADDGVFHFELTAPRRVYRPTDPIEPIATVSYVGPGEQIGTYHAGQVVGWAIDEVDGTRTMSGIMTAPCTSAVMRKDTPLAFPFAKSGIATETFDGAWYADPDLHLPAGTWRIRAYTTLAADDGPAPSDGSFTCGTRGHGQDAAIVVTVVGEGTEPSPTPSAVPTAGPSSNPSAAIPSPSFSTGPVVDSGNDGTFRLDLITPHGTYAADEPIAPVATLFYVGPDPSVTFGHSDPAVVFSIEEVGGDRTMTGVAADSCSFTTLAAGQPSAIPFRKSGQLGLGFDADWFHDPVLHLPPGTWRIRVRLEATVPACEPGSEIHEPSAENLIQVLPVR